MGSKKRIRVKLMEGQTDLATNNTVLVPSNKKIKTDNNKGEMGNGVMEIIKKRKQIDMEKQPKQMNISGLPEFHVSVFKDLASKDSSVRDAALEKIVTELQEVQKEYDRLKDKDNLVDDDGGLKLDAQMDDGLDNCASSLRYAVHHQERMLRQGLDTCFATGFADVRDCLLGWLSAYGALTQSGRLAKEWLSDEDTLHIKEFMSAIIFLSGKKIYLKRKRDRKSKEIAKSVQCFCEIVIEESLLQLSHDRKHLAFDILLLLLPRLPSSFIQIVLSYKVIKCLIDILSTKDSWLYKDGRNFLKELLVWVRNDDVRRAAVIVAFQKHNNGKFDCITKTKTVRDLMAEFKTESGCFLIVENLINLFLNDHASNELTDQSQTTAMLVVYFDNKKSPIKSGFLKEIFRRHPRIFRRLLGSL
ncbi:hypothetical protein E1A91_D02G237300v1 [Gossypium mustelinum]|uniref:Uncharacterized protein n=1 Tax=Gossypium mustelinum TaxID=34275 RepID=A0A5D2VZW7_GOSMU|nr:hypothetical protein E1A91_D02G237300v1 [Gossypium mustelinum]